MEAIARDEFLEWAAHVGIGFDPRCPAARVLGFIPPTEHARFWLLPGDPATWPDFAALILDGLDPWSVGYLWPRSSHWPTAADSSCYNEGVRDVVLRGIGVPDSWAGAIRFQYQEGNAVLAILFVYLAFGWCISDDLFFVPDHAREVVQTDHHGAILVQCAEERRMLDLVDRMERAGHLLPTEPPDATFRWQPWMAHFSAQALNEDEE